MDTTKEGLLNKTYNDFLDIFINDDLPISYLDIIAAEDIMGFGTTLDEKVFTLSGLKVFAQRQRDQSVGIQVDWKISPLVHRIAEDGNSAVFNDDVSISITVNNEIIEMPMRLSVVLEYIEDKWLVVHWHASKPENVESEKDTFGIEDWKQKNAELEIRVKERTAELEQSLKELKAIQSQLVQQEKLASLGQLTAGIAHEIKNPLNFVNNFSELSLEYIDEINEALNKLGKNEITEEIAALLADVQDNLKKVHQHGTRADNIVKSMLLHSRGGNGKLEPTDLNALIAEYVNLAFHGMRAGKEAINVKIDLDLDETVNLVDLNVEDFSRVILNLCKNAFDAMRTKAINEVNYNPKLLIGTKNTEDGSVTIFVEDNGPGVPEDIKDKLFQPFFTTKKGTEGTGLGLSITHDIIQKYKGTIIISSQENAFTRFEIRLPKLTEIKEL